jgi:hypothetical protein
MKKSLIIFSMIFFPLNSANVCAESNLIQEVLEKHELERQEFKPIIFDSFQSTPDDTSLEEIAKSKDQKSKKISFKNEFFQSIKIVLSSANDFKIIYLNPYEQLDGISIEKKEDYKIKVYNLDEKYLGNLLKTDLAKKEIVRISPFLIFPEINQKKTIGQDNVILKKPANTIEEKVEIKANETPTKYIEMTPKEIKVEPVVVESLKSQEPKALMLDNSGNEFKVANISDYRVKVSIKKADGESIGTNWTIDNDVYSPEVLKFASQAVILEPDTNINIIYLDKDDQIKREVTIAARDIPKDEHNNYTYFIENIASD